MILEAQKLQRLGDLEQADVLTAHIDGRVELFRKITRLNIVNSSKILLTTPISPVHEAIQSPSRQVQYFVTTKHKHSNPYDKSNTTLPLIFPSSIC